MNEHTQRKKMKARRRGSFLGKSALEAGAPRRAPPIGGQLCGIYMTQQLNQLLSHIIYESNGLTSGTVHNLPVCGGDRLCRNKRITSKRR